MSEPRPGIERSVPARRRTDRPPGRRNGRSRAGPRLSTVADAAAKPGSMGLVRPFGGRIEEDVERAHPGRPARRRLSRVPTVTKVTGSTFAESTCGRPLAPDQTHLGDQGAIGGEVEDERPRSPSSIGQSIRSWSPARPMPIPQAGSYPVRSTGKSPRGPPRGSGGKQIAARNQSEKEVASNRPMREDHGAAPGSGRRGSTGPIANGPINAGGTAGRLGRSTDRPSLPLQDARPAPPVAACRSGRGSRR